MQVFDADGRLLGVWMPAKKKPEPRVSKEELALQRMIASLIERFEDTEGAKKRIRELELERDALREEKERCGWSYCYPPETKARLKDIEVALENLEQLTEGREKLLRSIKEKMAASHLWQSDPFEYPFYNVYIGPDLEGLL